MMFTQILHRVNVFVFVLCLTYASAASNGNEEQNKQISQGSRSFHQKAVMVMASTFSVGLVVGGLWCYCMSAVCSARQSDHTKRGRLTAVRSGDYMRRNYPPSGSLPRSESPTSSTSSLDRSSPIP